MEKAGGCLQVWITPSKYFGELPLDLVTFVSDTASADLE
jgi:hypothetical protein